RRGGEPVLLNDASLRICDRVIALGLKTVATLNAAGGPGERRIQQTSSGRSRTGSRTRRHTGAWPKLVKCNGKVICRIARRERSFGSDNVANRADGRRFISANLGAQQVRDGNRGD